MTKGSLTFIGESVILYATVGYVCSASCQASGCTLFTTIHHGICGEHFVWLLAFIVHPLLHCVREFGYEEVWLS